jgi:hypothetical protein
MAIGGNLVAVLAVSCVLLAAAVAYLLGRRPSRAPQISIHSSIEHLRAIGQLSVFKVFTKEIVTETDHTWGDFGRKYLSWVISARKMAMIFEFEIDFRYDLRRPEFAIVPAGQDAFTVRMPPCVFEAHIRDIRFYDEQRSRFMPWLLPDLLNGFLPGGFSEEDKNKLVAAARSHAQQQARGLIGSLQAEVQNSARATLQSISKAFGAREAFFDFLPQGDIRLDVTVPRQIAA